MHKLTATAAATLVALVTTTGAATEPVNEDVVARLKVEGFQNSQVMETLSWLSDVYGPRLSGSDNLSKAGEWARDQMTRWGLQHAALEPYDNPIFRGWSLQHFSIDMVEPQYMRIYGYPMAWSPATAAPLTGTPIVVTVKSKDDFEKYRGKLRGALVMNGRPDTTDIGFQARSNAPDRRGARQARARDQPGEPSSLKEEEEDFNKRPREDGRDPEVLPGRGGRGADHTEQHS